MGYTKLLNLLISSGDILEQIDDLSTWEKPDTCTIGVHGYNWVYNVLRSCTPTSEDRDIADFELANKFMSKVSYLLRCGFTPYIVFDGAELLVKEATDSKGKGQHLTDVGDTLKRKEPRVTHQIIFSLIQTLNSKNVKFVVAPYKADSQLAYLLLNKDVDIILSEDAGLILYGCEKIIFDKGGHYYEYDFSRLKGSKLFRGFTKEMVLQACMLGGCEYLSNLSSVGLKPAIDVMKKKCKELITRQDAYIEVIKPAKGLKQNKGKEDEMFDYIQRFTKVMLTYKHQRVYNPTNQTFVCLTPFPKENQEDLQPYIGLLPTSPNATPEDFANGIIHPNTKCRMEVDITDIKGGYIYSKVDLIGEYELQINLEIERLFRATSILKDLQEAMFDVARYHFLTLSRQISKEKKVSKAGQKYEEEDDYNFLGKGASIGLMSNAKIDKVEEYKDQLKKKVIGPLNKLIDNASLQVARHGAEHYSRMRQEAELQNNPEKLENLKRLPTLCEKIHQALSSVEADQRKETYEILVHMSKLESLHCKDLATMYKTMLESFNS